MISGYSSRTKPKPGAQINPAHPLSRGLVGYWLFNEGAGSQANDISQHANHGHSSNFSPSGWVGTADGGGIAVDAANSTKFTLRNTTLTDFSIVARIANIQNTSTINTIVCQYTGTLIFYTRDVINLWYSGAVHPANTTLSAGNAYTVGITAIGGSGTFYLNGDLDGTCAGVPGFTLNTLLNNSWGNGFTGIMNDIRVYDRGLSGQEMKQLQQDPVSNLLTPRNWYVPSAGPVGAIMNQFQNSNVGADLFNGSLQ